MNSMRNLEKLGILVIVILVVVVGVVAITPGEDLNRALNLTDVGLEDSSEGVREIVPSAEPPLTTPPPTAPPSIGGSAQTGSERQEEWPSDRLGAEEQRQLAARQDPDPREAAPGRDAVAPPVEVRPGPRQRAEAPKFRTYVVARGDSLYRIAERELGSARHMGTLKKLNPAVDPDRLKIGQELRLPVDPDAAVAERSPVRPDRSQPKGPGGTYVVRKGDTLSEIARTQLGSSQRWREIVRLNNDVLRGSARIAPGMKLRLPGSAPGGDGVLALRNPPTPNGREYVVQKGDTLSGIAREKLGSAGRWTDIRDLNADALGGGNLLQVGMKLALPKR